MVIVIKNGFSKYFIENKVKKTFKESTNSIGIEIAKPISTDSKLFNILIILTNAGIFRIQEKYNASAKVKSSPFIFGENDLNLFNDCIIAVLVFELALS